MAEPKINAALATDPSKINPTGAQQEDLSEYQQSLQDQIKALEQRYAQPNWFKVAAGFLKPQLGGFAASLGSAAEAAGENVELQRAAALPIAQMRSQLAQSKILTGQNKTQSDEFEAWRATGQPMDAATYSRIVSLNPESPVAKAAQKFYEGAKSTLEITTQATAAQGKDPMMNVMHLVYGGKPMTEQQMAQVEQTINANKPPQIDQNTWNGLDRYAKMEAAREYAKAQTTIGLSEEERSREQAKGAYDRLPLLRSIRELALGQGIPEVKDASGKTVSGQEQMANALNYFGGNNPIEVLARAAADGKLGEKLAGFDAYARQANMSPQVRDDFQKLVKLLAENQVSLRNSSTNPTDAYTSMQTMSSPNIGNSQKALVTLVDLIGHGEKHAQERHNYMVNSNVPARQLRLDPKFKQLEAGFADEHSRIALQDPSKATPSWYSPRVGTEAAPAPAVRPAPTSGGSRPAFQLPPGFERDPSDPTGRRIRRVQQ